jgi:hypothetical protein
MIKFNKNIKLLYTEFEVDFNVELTEYIPLQQHMLSAVRLLFKVASHFIPVVFALASSKMFHGAI